METPVLLFDGKCQICRNLAVKVQFHAKKPLEIMALSDPDAAARLEKFYPKGWKHNFYLLENGSCREGLRAIPKLISTLGLRQFGSLVGEYASYKLATTKARCVHGQDHAPVPTTASGNGQSRREVLAMAAAAPLLAPLSRLGPLSDPFEGRVPERLRGTGFDVNLAVVWRDANGTFRAEVMQASHAILEEGDFNRSGIETKILDRKHSTIKEFNAPGDQRVVLRRTSLEAERPLGGTTERRFVDSYSLGLDHARYNVSLNLGTGTVDGPNGTQVATTFSGMIRHDLPIPLIDHIVFAGDEGTDVAIHLAGYVEGVRALRSFHASGGRDRVAKLYQQIEAGLMHALAGYQDNIREHLVPLKSKVVITSMPELLKFVDIKPLIASLPERVSLPAGAEQMIADSVLVKGGCECTCSCGCCCGCGCGCGCGLCGCSCDCFCCCECGCGCSCACCA